MEIQRYADQYWLNQWGLVNQHPGEPKDWIEENGILFTVEHWLLSGQRYDMTRQIMYHISKGLLWQTPELKKRCRHDNMTAITVWQVLNGVQVTAKWWRYPHPRDMIFILYCKRNPIGILLSPLLLPVFLWTALTTHKTRNGIEILKTDTEILWWIRTYLPKKYWIIQLSKKFMVPLLKKRFGKNYVKGMFEIYFNYDDHPVIKILR